MAKDRLQNLGNRSEQARARLNLIRNTEGKFHREPLTHVFDEWNEEIRRRNIETGLLSPIECLVVTLVLVVFLLILKWF